MNTFEKLALYKLQCQMKNGGGGSEIANSEATLLANSILEVVEI